MWISAEEEHNVHLDTGPSGLAGLWVAFKVVVLAVVVVVI